MPLEGPLLPLVRLLFSTLCSTTASERKHIFLDCVSFISEHVFTKRLHVIFEMFSGIGHVGFKKVLCIFRDQWFPAAVSSCYTTNTPIDWFSWFGFGQKAA